MGDKITIAMIVLQTAITIAHAISGERAKAFYWFACVMANLSILKLK